SSSKINYGAVAMRDDEIMESHANTSFLTRLGWSAEFSIEKGVDWLTWHSLRPGEPVVFFTILYLRFP
ncbi:hypothetical protein ONQ60_27460, partial [Salmonella enterica subsp. enterica serovar Virginia]|nr:hypothetical protein [Salmonella enterica subsp. enterica serovar Virginia]